MKIKSIEIPAMQRKYVVGQLHHESQKKIAFIEDGSKIFPGEIYTAYLVYGTKKVSVMVGYNEDGTVVTEVQGELLTRVERCGVVVEYSSEEIKK